MERKTVAINERDYARLENLAANFYSSKDRPPTPLETVLHYMIEVAWDRAYPSEYKPYYERY